MTNITITREQLIRFEPCDLQARLERWPATILSMDILQAFAAGFTVSDVLWIAAKLGLGNDCARVAVFAARQVAALNSDPRVQAAIDAAQYCIDNPSDAVAYAAYVAADAANAAADDADDDAYTAIKEYMISLWSVK